MAKKFVKRVRRNNGGEPTVMDDVTAEEPQEAAVKKTVAKVAEKRVAKTVKKGGKNKSKIQTMRDSWTGPENIRQMASTALKGMMHRAAVESGDPDICVVGETGRLVVGIKLPSFCFEYLIQNNVWPLGRMAQFVGIEKSCKSGLAFEVGRWFVDYASGLVGLCEHETKFSPDWANSIIGWQNGDSFGYIPCDSVDEWQKWIQFYVKQNKDIMLGDAKNPGPGMIYPFLGIIDSIFGKSLKSSQDKIKADGHASRDYAVEAQIITKFLRAFPQQIRQWPFSIIMVNHLRPSVDALTKQVVRDKPGGRGKDFQESLELELRKGGKIRTKDYDGFFIHIICAVSSLGIEKRRISVPVIWWEEPLDDSDPKSPWRQKTVWDWHAATTDLLLKMEGTEATRRKDVIDINRVPKESSVWSKRLGISKSSPVSYRDFGQAIMDNPEVLRDLRRAYGIKEREMLVPGSNYREIIGDAKRQIGKKIKYR